MERTTPPEEQGRGRTDEPKTNSLDASSKLTGEDPVLVFVLEPSETKLETQQRLTNASEFGVSTSLPLYEPLKTNRLEPAVAEWTPEDLLINATLLEPTEPPVNSPWLIQSPPSLPYEDILFDGVIVKHALEAVEDLSGPSTQASVTVPDPTSAIPLEHCEPPREDELGPVNSLWLIHSTPSLPYEDILFHDVIQKHALQAVEDLSEPSTQTPVPYLDPTSLLPWSEKVKNTDMNSPQAENILNQAELISFQMQPQEKDLADLQVPYVILECSVSPQLQSEPCFKTREKTAMLPNKGNLSPGQHVSMSQPQLGHPEPLDLGSVCEQQLLELQLPSTSIQPPNLGADQGPATFQDLSRPPPHSFSQYSSTEAHPNVCQAPVSFDSHYPQPVQLFRPSYFPLVLPLDVNCMQPSNQLASICFQPHLQPSIYLPYCFIPDVRPDPAGNAFDNWAPLVPQINSKPVLVSHFNTYCPPPLCYQDPLFMSPLYQTNIGSQLAHSNTHSPLWVSGVERPPVAQSRCDGNDDSEKLQENYSLWKTYCKVAKCVYTSSPDVEALACFFIPVIRSVTLQHPEIPFPEAVNTAVSEWEKLCNFDRMEYYNIAHKFMDIEVKELSHQLAGEEAGAVQQTANHKQVPAQKQKQPGSTPKKRGAGSKAQKAKGGSRTSQGSQALRTDVQDLAGEALREYSEIMEALESLNKGGSEDTKEKEEVNDGDEEEGSFVEYLNELCSQKKFVTEVDAEIDMAFISSLLSSDSNATDKLMQPEHPVNTQDVTSDVPAVPGASHFNWQTTDSSSQNHPQSTSQASDTNVQKLQSNLDAVTEASLLKTLSAGNEAKTTEDNNNENKCLTGKHEMTQIQEDNTGTNMELFLMMEDYLSEVSSAVQLLHEDNSNVPADWEAGHLQEATSLPTYSCSGVDPPRTLSSLAAISTLKERQTPKENLETCPVVDQVFQEASKTEEQSITPQQNGAATDSSTRVSDPQGFNLVSNIVQQGHVGTVTQNEFNKLDPVEGKTRDPIVSSQHTQEWTVSECLDVDTPSEPSTMTLDSTSDEVDPKPTTYLKDAAVEIPVEHEDGGTVKDCSLENAVPSSTVEDTRRKEVTEVEAEVTDEIDRHIDSEGTLTVEDNHIEEVSHVKTKNGVKENINNHTSVANPGYLENKAQAAAVTQMRTEMPEFKTTVEDGNTSTGEAIAAENSLCMSEDSLCQDLKTGQHKQDKERMKRMSLVTKNDELTARNNMEILNKNKSNDQKTRSNDGRKCETMTSKAKALMVEEPSNREMGLRRVGGSREEPMTRVKTKPTLTSETDPEITEKEQRETKEDRMRRRKDDGRLTKNVMEKGTKAATVDLEVESTFRSEASSESRNISSTSTTENAQHETQPTDLQRKKDIAKGQRNEKRGMYMRILEIKVVETVRKTLKEKEIPGEKQNRRISKEKTQTPSKQEPDRNSQPDHSRVGNSKRRLSSLRSKEATRTRNVKTDKQNAGNPTKAAGATSRQVEAEAEKMTSIQIGRRRTRRTAAALEDDVQGGQVPVDRGNTSRLVSSESRSLVDVPRTTRAFGANLGKSSRTTRKQVTDKEAVAESTARERLKKGQVGTEIGSDASAQPNRARRSCGASVAVKTAESGAPTKEGGLSSDASAGKHFHRCERRLRSASVLSITGAGKDRSKETTKNVRRERRRCDGDEEVGKVHHRASDGSLPERRQTRSCTASHQLQVEKRGIERKDEPISKCGADQKMRSGVGKSVEESFATEGEKDKTSKDVRRCKITKRSGSLEERDQGRQEMVTRGRRMIEGKMKTRGTMIRNEIAKGTAHPTHDLKERQSTRQGRGPKSQAQSRSLRRCLRSLAPTTPQTRVEGRSTGPKETAERFAEASEPPSSSRTLRRITRGSPANPTTSGEKGAEKRGQQGSVRISSVLYKKTEGKEKKKRGEETRR